MTHTVNSRRSSGSAANTVHEAPEQSRVASTVGLDTLHRALLQQPRRKAGAWQPHRRLRLSPALTSNLTKPYPYPLS